MRFARFEDFWPYYLSQHRHRQCQRLHVIGTSLAIVLVLGAALTRHYGLLLAAPVVGYGLAWLGHFYFEKNRPAAFEHPLWSLRGDLRMLWLTYTGRLPAELARLGL